MAESWHAVAVQTELAAGQMRVYEVAGKSVLLCHTEEGYFAVDNTCSHDDGPLEGGELDGCEIECPRHGARFDARTGTALCLPAVTGIRHYPTRIQGNEVQIKMD